MNNILLLVLVFAICTLQVASGDDDVQSLRQEIHILKEQMAKIQQIIKQQNNAVGFTAYIGTDKVVRPGETIVFPDVHSNVGDAYNEGTGEFECPVAGLYYFSLTTYTGDDNLLTTQIMHGDDSGGTSATFNDHANNDQGSNSATIQCAAGERVYVKHTWTEDANLRAYLKGNGNTQANVILNSFSGFLIALL